MSISEHRSKQFSGQFDLDQIRRILILRMGPLGETLLTTPVIRALRGRFRRHTSLTWSPQDAKNLFPKTQIWTR